MKIERKTSYTITLSEEDMSVMSLLGSYTCANTLRKFAESMRQPIPEDYSVAALLLQLAHARDVR